MHANLDRREFLLACGAACVPLLGACAHVQYLSAVAADGRLAITKASLATVPFAFVPSTVLLTTLSRCMAMEISVFDTLPMRNSVLGSAGVPAATS